jgi:hypothetical protein
MRSARFGCALVVVLLYALGGPADADVLYGPSASGGGGSALFTIDQTTAAATTIGPLGLGAGVGLTGLAFESSSILWGSTRSQIGQVDPDTGAITLLTGTVDRISDLAVQPGTGTLYGHTGGTSLSTLDKVTGTTTSVVGSLPDFRGGLAFAPDGTLYFTSGTGILFTLDPTDGTVLTSTPLSINVVLDGLGVRPSDGLLFGTRGGPFTQVYTIDPDSGVTTLVGNAQNISDLTFRPAAVPAPAALILLGAGLLGIAARRRLIRRRP